MIQKKYLLTDHLWCNPFVRKACFESTDKWFRDEYSKYESIQECKSCLGKRLNEKALSVKLIKKYSRNI